MAEEKCGRNKLKRRNGGQEGLEIAIADEATCPNDSDVCCARKEIVNDCSDYKEDGYKCVKICHDGPQDFVPESKRKSKAKPYTPKESKCPSNEICCRKGKRSQITPGDSPRFALPTTKCSDQEGYKCLEFDQCSDKFAVKESDVDPIFQNTTSEITIDLRSNLINLNSAGGITIDLSKSPCKSPNKVCCQPKIGPSPPPEPAPVKCGVHNVNGLKRGGIPVRYVNSNAPFPSQQGEWPHTCIILKDSELLGGASLIAPKIVVTAAHIIRYVSIFHRT